VLIDRLGVVRKVISGVTESEIDSLEEEIKKLLAEK